MTCPGSASNVVPLRAAYSVTRDPVKSPTTVLHVVASDEELVEVASVITALDRRPAFRQILVYGGDNVEVLRGTKLARVHHRIDTRTGSQAQRTATALVAMDALLREEQPEVVMVAGDDELVLAAATTSAKQQIAVARLGAGHRCWDWTLTDEINRTVIDRLADSLFTASADAGTNLRDEGVPDGRIHFVGNTGIDTLRRYEADALTRAAWKDYGAEKQAYTLVTLERPESMATAERPARIVAALGDLTATAPVLLLQRPRTGALNSQVSQSLLAAAGVRSVEPVPYLEALSLKAGAGAIVTDADAVQDEASALGISCYTLAQTTARTVTLTHGTNVLLGPDPSAIAFVAPARRPPTPAAIPLWDGRAGERVASALVANYTFGAYAETQ